MVSLTSELYRAARLSARARAGAGELVAVNAGRPSFSLIWKSLSRRARTGSAAEVRKQRR